MSEDLHYHSHAPQPLTNVHRAFYIGIGLNLFFVLLEAIAGLAIHSLALISDAGHNLADVAGLALSLLSFRLLKVKSNQVYTYGYRKSTILVALLNAVVLLVSIGAIAYEAVHRLFQPEPLPGITIASVAAIGIVINSISAWLFLHDQEKEINARGAYLHMLADALLSLGVVIGGVIIYFTHWFWIDPLISIALVVFILIGTWNLLRSSVRMSMDAVPENISFNEVKQAMLQIKGVQDVHHIHIWSMSSTENALTAHIVIDESTSLPETEKLKQQIKHELEHQHISHATLEFEMRNAECETEEI
ncbi:MAG TPA: cation diffusion facilitator family transporter [Chitinophagales bacterium]|nr:cation diffusion facilitator family transporter [Chitinophagales bacterium]